MRIEARTRQISGADVAKRFALLGVTAAIGGGAAACGTSAENASDVKSAGPTSPTVRRTVDLLPSQNPGEANQKHDIVWPTTAVAAAEQMGLPDSAAKYLTQDDNKVWTAEFFPFATHDQDGNPVTVTFENGVHKVNGVETNDPSKIFDFSAEPEWQAVTNNSESGTLFARTGGAGPDDQKDTNRYIGPGGSTGQYIEQASLIPASPDCVDQPEVDAWRNAVKAFVYDTNAQNQVVTIEWYNPATKAFDKLDGKTISSYAKTMEGDQDKKAAFAEVIEKLPAGYPLTPEQAVAMTGGTTKPENWTLNIDTGVWTFEGFNLANGVSYDQNAGVLKKGNDIVGTDTGYDYTHWQEAKSELWATKWVFPSLPGVYGFARTGGGSDYQPNTSYYGSGMGNLKATLDTNGVRGIEQGAIIPVAPVEGCTAAEALPNAVAQDAKSQANNPDVQAVYLVTPLGTKQFPKN